MTVRCQQECIVLSERGRNEITDIAVVFHQKDDRLPVVLPHFGQAVQGQGHVLHPAVYDERIGFHGRQTHRKASALSAHRRHRYFPFVHLYYLFGQVKADPGAVHIELLV